MGKHDPIYFTYCNDGQDTQWRCTLVPISCIHGIVIGGFIFTTWMAGKIYRTGILMYGKKASWKEMFKWAFKKS